uniref:barstar family protein n=1 Tax=Candidatus Fimivicinus sp. TaxID=3056640 RepID=UPI003FEF652F
MSKKIKEINLDFTGVKTLWELHERIRIAFDFPEWYGKNWDAFWDLLSEPRDETMVTVRGLKMLPKELQPCGKKVIELLEENGEYQMHWKRNPQKFRYVIIS